MQLQTSFCRRTYKFEKLFVVALCLQQWRASCKSTSALEGMLRGDKSVLVFLTGHEGMLLYFGSFGTDVSSSILAKQNNPSLLIIIILYASVLVFLTGVGLYS